MYTDFATAEVIEIAPPDRVPDLDARTSAPHFGLNASFGHCASTKRKSSAAKPDSGSVVM